MMKNLNDIIAIILVLFLFNYCKEKSTVEVESVQFETQVLIADTSFVHLLI